jgi:hypothetical protein
MPLDFKAAMSKLKSNPGKGLHFFFCEQGADGKPVLLVDTKAISGSQQAEVLKTAKKKSKCAGEMEVNKEGELELTPKGSTPTSLAKGVQVVARNANAMPKAIVLKPPVPEDKEPQGDIGDEAPPQPLPISSDVPTSYSTGHPSEVPTSYLTGYPSEVPTSYSTEIPPKGPQVSKEIIARLKTSTAKKFPDVLRSDPTMAKLLDKKAKTTTELATAMKKPGVTDQEIQPLVGKLDKIDQALELAQRKLNEQGVKPQQLGEEYKDENKKMGWRHKVGEKPEREEGESDEQFAARMQDYEDDLKLHESKLETTNHFSDEEREQSKVNVDAKGRLLDAEGEVIYGGESMEYVMDRDGQLHRFEPKDVGNDLIQHPVTGELVKRNEYVHHSSVLRGEEVTGAGGIETEGGKISRVSNMSGHYKPGRAQMIQTVEVLLKNGALLDKQWVDANGQPLSGKAQDVYKAAMKLQKKIMAKLEDEPDTDVTADLATIENAKKMLSKLGCGPSNRMSPAMVDFLEIREGMTGAEVHMAKASVKQNAKTVKEFLTTGGGSTEDGENKSQMQQELLEKTAKKRETLDRMAEVRAKRVGETGTSGPSEDELENMTDDLKSRKRALKEDDDDEVGDDDPEERLYSGNSMPKEFKESTVRHPTKSGYSLSAGQLASDLKIPIEELWKQLKEKRGGDGPTDESPDDGSTNEEKPKGKPMPKSFAGQMVNDPDLPGYKIEANKLASRLGVSIEELWEQLQQE